MKQHCFSKQYSSCRVCPVMRGLVYFIHMNLLTSPGLLTFLGLLISINVCRIGLNFGMEICKWNESKCESSLHTVKRPDLVLQPRVRLKLARELVGPGPCFGNPGFVSLTENVLKHTEA